MWISALLFLLAASFAASSTIGYYDHLQPYDYIGGYHLPAAQQYGYDIKPTLNTLQHLNTGSFPQPNSYARIASYALQPTSYVHYINSAPGFGIPSLPSLTYLTTGDSSFSNKDMEDSTSSFGRPVADIAATVPKQTSFVPASLVYTRGHQDSSPSFSTGAVPRASSFTTNAAAAASSSTSTSSAPSATFSNAIVSDVPSASSTDSVATSSSKTTTATVSTSSNSIAPSTNDETLSLASPSVSSGSAATSSSSSSVSVVNSSASSNSGVTGQTSTTSSAASAATSSSSA